MTHQDRLNLTSLDTEPTNLHLIIGTTSEHQLPTRGPTHQIPRAIHPRTTNSKRIRHEPLTSQTRAPQIPTSQPRPRHIQLPHHTNRTRPQPRIQHIHTSPRQRNTDRDRGIPLATFDYVAGRECCGLRRTIGIDHTQHGACTKGGQDRLTTNNITTRPQLVKAGETTRILLRNQLEEASGHPYSAEVHSVRSGQQLESE